MTNRVESLESAIHYAETLMHILEKELSYDYSVTDEVQNIIDALEYDLGEERVNHG